MRGERNTDKNTRKFISISDMEKWEQIDELMSMPKYEKSFNKVINKTTNGRMLKEGYFRDTPEYLESYEKRSLRELMQKRRKKEMT